MTSFASVFGWYLYPTHVYVVRFVYRTLRLPLGRVSDKNVLLTFNQKSRPGIQTIYVLICLYFS